MNRYDTGREDRACDSPASNRSGAQAENHPFSQAKAAALRVMAAEPLQGTVFLEGGLVPWIVSGRDSGRLHGDVDFSVRLADMPAVREWLAREGLYDRSLDSLDLACNASRADFGAHALVDGVPVSFCPFFFEGGALVQRNAALARFEGFDALFEARVPGIAEEDLVEVREVPGAGRVGISTLESCRAAKAASGRAKDLLDVAEIDHLGCNAGRLARAEAAFAGMSVRRVAFGEPGAERAGDGGPEAAASREAAHWVAGALSAARRLPPEESSLLFRSCAAECITGRGLLGRFEGVRDAAGGDPDAFFSLLGSTPGVSTAAAEPGRAWRMSYGSCTCPVVRAGLTRDPVLCECSRQSVAFVLDRLFPEGCFYVRLEGSILAGDEECAFLITRM